MNGCKDKCRTRGVTWFMVAVCSFAMLIWARLRLVTGVPRTAYATPEHKPQDKNRNEATTPDPSGPAENR